MTIDTSDLRSTISALEDQVARLRRIADAADAHTIPVTDPASVGLAVPPDIIVRRLEEIVGYVRAHPHLKDLVTEMAAALVDEFRGERSEIELVLYQDPEIDDRQLTFYVRLPEYDDSLMPRIRAVSEHVDNRFPPGPDWVHVTTDFHPMR